LVTRNAINPRHAFSDTNPAVQDALADSAEHASHSAKHADDVDAPVVAGEHFTDNLQAVDEPKFTDNWQALDKTNITDNWQSLGKAHQQDNMQGVDTDAFHDNRQSLGPSQSIQEQKLYLEKKSIRDNRQKVTSSIVQRAAPQMPAHVSDSPVQSNAPQRPVNQTAGTHDKAAVAGASQPTEDDELRARMKKLKATVRDVNETLSDLAPKPDPEP
jgi:transcription-repair coupling factor (superfamily II helicase)